MKEKIKNKLIKDILDVVNDYCVVYKYYKSSKGSFPPRIIFNGRYYTWSLESIDSGGTLHSKQGYVFALDEITSLEVLWGVLQSISSSLAGLRAEYEYDLGREDPPYLDDLLTNGRLFLEGRAIENLKLMTLIPLYKKVGTFERELYKPDWELTGENDIIGLFMDPESLDLKFSLSYNDGPEFLSKPLREASLSEILEISNELAK